MTLDELRHLIRAAAKIAQDDEIIVVGSQAILGEYPDARPEFLVSNEADLWPRNRPAAWEEIDGAIGELSLFHEQFGYYAQGVAPETAVLPSGWEGRVVKVPVDGSGHVAGYCIGAEDLFISKAVAMREKDRAFIKAMIQEKMVGRERILKLVDQLPESAGEPNRKRRVRSAIIRLWKEVEPRSSQLSGPGKGRESS